MKLSLNPEVACDMIKTFRWRVLPTVLIQDTDVRFPNIFPFVMRSRPCVSILLTRAMFRLELP